MLRVALLCLLAAGIWSWTDLSDTSEHCADWASKGECGQNEDYMRKACAFSCARHCGEISPQQCKRQREELEARLAESDVLLQTAQRREAEQRAASADWKNGLIICENDKQKYISEARRASFEELKASHKKQIDTEIAILKRRHQGELETLRRQAAKREYQLQNIVDQSATQIAELKRELELLKSGKERRDALERASFYGQAYFEGERKWMQCRENMQDMIADVGAHERELVEQRDDANARADQAEERAAAAESSAASLSEQLALIGIPAVTSNSSNSSFRVMSPEEASCSSAAESEPALEVPRSTACLQALQSMDMPNLAALMGFIFQVVPKIGPATWTMLMSCLSVVVPTVFILLFLPSRSL